MKERSAPFVGVIVLNHNGVTHLKEIFSSLARMDYVNAEISMVDNASSDDSVSLVRKNFPNVHIIQNRGNEHFAKGMNLGMQLFLHKNADYLALLNNDIEVDQRWLSELVSIAESDPAIGAVASRMMYYHNRKIINGLGVGFNLMGYAWDRYQGETFKVWMQNSQDAFSFCAGAALLNSKALRQVGLFDPWHIIYLEDVDLCFRLHAHGWRVVTAPSAVVYHKFSATMKQGSPMKDYLILRNRFKIILKYYPARELWPILIGRVLKKEMAIARHWLSSGEWRRCFYQFKALFDVMVLVPRLFWWRKIIGSSYRFSTFKLLEPSFEPVVLPFCSWDYERADRRKITGNRIIMGVSDQFLGDGWFPLEPSIPRYRWMCDEADCILSAEKNISSILQLHVFQPMELDCNQSLKIWLDEEEIGIFSIKPREWQTIQMRCQSSNDEVRVRFRVDPYIPKDLKKGSFDRGLAFNEISFIPESSPFVRKGIQRIITS